MIGSRLTELRKQRGLSQRELGDALDVSHYTISAYEKERSEPADQIKIELARYFDVSLDYLLGLIDQPLPFTRDEISLRIPEKLSPAQRQRLGQAIYELTETFK